MGGSFAHLVGRNQGRSEEFRLSDKRVRNLGAFLKPDEHDLSILGRAVHELRERQGLSLNTLADAAGITRAELTAIEAGRLDPGYRRLRRLAAGLGVRPIALLLRVEELDADDSG
jgi:DNA-binding XRE family transcriptional regulator